MEEVAEIVKILNTAGYIVKDCQMGAICIADPTCIWPPLVSFIKTAWMVLTAITGVLLAGWAAVLLRGAKNDYAKNFKTLILMFGTLSLALPAVDFLGGGKFVVNQCATIKIPADQVQELLKMRGQKLKQNEYEVFEVIDSAADDPDFNF